MITWNIQKTSKKRQFKIAGHAEFDVIGKDIVCSAVSSIVQTSINIAYCMGFLLKYEYDKQNDKMEIIFKAKTEQQRAICNVLEWELISLSQQYPDNVRKVEDD